MDFMFQINTRIHFGAGKTTKLGPEAAGFGLNKWLLVTDENLIAAGYVDRVKAELAGSGQEAVVYAGIDHEPEDHHIAEGMEVYNSQDCAGIIALGGGSVLDAGKAMAIIAGNGGEITQYAGLNNVPKPKVPMIAIPTTAGTGSEVTRALGLTNTKTHVKFVIVASTVAPEVAIDDPELTINLPPSITAETGLDAFSHAMEAFISKTANPISDTLALRAMEIISGNLRQAYQDGKQIAAREQMMLGQLMAAMSVMNAGVCLIHGMGRPLGAYFHVPHGLANAMLSPMVMRFSWQGNVERYARVARAMGVSTDGLSPEEAAQAGITAMDSLCQDLAIPAFSSLNLDKERYKELIPQMASDCLASGSPANNPVVPSQAEVERLYAELIQG